MTKMVKGSFDVSINGEKHGVNGYLFDLLLADNTIRKMGVYNNEIDKRWDVIDTASGKSLCHSTTRKDAVARAESEPMVKQFTAYLNKATEKEDNVDKVKELEDKVAELEKALAAAKAAENGWKAKAEEYYAAKKPAAPKAPAKKPTAKKATAKKAPAKPKAPKAPAKKPSNEVNLNDLLATMREWCKTHPNTAATRKPGNNSAVRVLGVERFDQKTQDELTELGFRWAGGPQCWMFGEQQAQKQGKTVIDGR